MRPARLELLAPDLVDQVLAEAFGLLLAPGVRVEAEAAQDALRSVGVPVQNGVARIPERAVRAAIETAPTAFALYGRTGGPVVHYGGEAVHFDPGSCAVHILDAETLEHRQAVSADLVCLVRVAEALPELDAQSTAVVCHDVPATIGDLYRLFLVLLNSAKPIVTGSFRAHGIPPMVALLEIDSGGVEALRQRPRAIFDVCPSPPLRWTEFGAQNLVDLAQACVPAQIVSMPLAGATAPVTLLGAVVQQAAEVLSGIVIHQAVRPGAPLVWGGAPAIFDMRAASTPMGAIETAMIDVAYAQIGRHLGLPTHTYLGASDAKVVDAQAGMESGMTALLAGLAGIHMVSGAGMLDFLACQSAEKLVLDAEAIGMAQRFLSGMGRPAGSLAADTFTRTGFAPDFLKLPETRALFRREQRLPSAVIDRQSLRGWQESGRPDAFQRARARVARLLQQTEPTELGSEVAAELRSFVLRLAAPLGLQTLPST